MKLSYWLTVAAFSGVLIYGCVSEKTTSSATKNSSKSAKTVAEKPIILSVGDDKISTEDFKYVYEKNNGKNADAYTSASLNDYLQLYIKFRLKVREAESMGLDTTAGFKSELAGYQKQLAQPYLTEKQVTDMLVQQAYDRMKIEIHAAHILILCSADAEPKDTLIAYNKAKALKERAAKGEKFEDLAFQYSEDPSAKTNKGDLGYFTALSMVYEFEDAAYNTKVGDISNPVRTKFGYHLIDVLDRRPSQGQVHVAHIMVRFTQGMSADDSIKSKEKIDEIYKELKAGEDWNELCLEFSDDVNSKGKGGELAWFSTGRMIPSFENAAFKLKTSGEYSAPISTPYGWHIIKLIERKPLGTFEELEPSIRAKVTKDSRSDLNRKMLIVRLKRDNQFEESSKGVDYAISKADSSLLIGNWSYLPSEKHQVTLFTISKQKYTAENFFAYVKEHQHAVKNSSPKSYMRNEYTEYVNTSLIAYEEDHLSDKYVDYRMLLKEYHDGILLFQLMEEKVWNKAVQDTAGLRKYYTENAPKYRWTERAHAYILSASDKAVLDKVTSDFQQKNYPVKEYSFDKIAFDKNKSVLNQAAKSQLEKLILLLNKDSHTSAAITLGREHHETIAISNLRKDSITAYVRIHGINLSRLTFIESAASPLRKTEAQRQADRYAEIQLFTSSKKYLENIYNQKTALTLQVNENMYQKNDNEMLNKCAWQVGECSFEKNNRFYHVIIDRIEQPRNKTFEEARGMIISDYQTYLESQWIEELRKKYPVVVNDAELQQLVKQP
ncbi:MAG: peptidylprolyl isomerase [Cytophagales bacterium]|nr:peptidylprolyl isomerase [Cytophaga sp.]